MRYVIKLCLTMQDILIYSYILNKCSLWNLWINSHLTDTVVSRKVHNPQNAYAGMLTVQEFFRFDVMDTLLIISTEDILK